MENNTTEKTGKNELKKSSGGKVSVAQAMIKCLEAENVTTIFGYPGAAICPFYDCLTDSKIKHILVRHEQSAGHAASGYARATGKPAVCVATSGPGATNLITSLATAYMDSIPVVAITGQVSTGILGSDAFQEADITGAVEPFIKHSFLVKEPKDIAKVFKMAFYIAGSGRPGPVLIDVPFDVQKAMINFEYPQDIDIRSYKPSTKGHPMQIKRIVSAISEAKKPLICTGGGVILCDAKRELREFARITNIPVVSTMMGIGTMPTDSPLYYGMIGMHGNKAANTAVKECDLLIIVGARVADRAIPSPKAVEKSAKIIHIDIDPAEIGKNMQADIPVVGDAKIILTQLLEKVEPQDHSDWIQSISDIKASIKPDDEDRNGAINPKEFIRLLSKAMPDDSIVVADVGQNQIWSANNYQIKNGKFMTTGGMGTMGYSLAAAMGAKAASPDTPVVSICGDGSFQMQFMELATMMGNNIPVKMVVMVNNRLGMVHELQKNLYKSNYSGVFLDGSPDFCVLASAYSIPSRRITSLSQAQSAIDEMISSKTAFLLECIVDSDESSL